MISLSKCWLVLGLSLSIFVSCSKEICSDSSSHAVVQGTTGTQLDELVLNEEDVKFSGAVLVAEGTSTFLNKSYGYSRPSNDCEVRPEESYWIASVSKSFCAVAVLLLYEQGRLDLQAPISTYITGVPSDKDKITVHQLLSHSSGIGDSYAAEGIANQKDALKALLDTDMIGSPGEGYSYSNVGYQLLAILVEVIGGGSYEQFVTEQIIRPLGLSNTGLAGDQQYLNVLNVAARGRGSRRSASGNPQLWEINYGYKGSTGILSNTDDLLAWNRALHENELLQPTSTQLLFEPHSSKGDDIFYGYGWNVFDSEQGEVIVHSGDDDFIGHNATLRYYPESNKLIVVLSDAGYYKGDPAARVIAKKLIPELFR